MLALFFFLSVDIIKRMSLNESAITGNKIEITIPKGSTLDQITEILYSRGLIADKDFFIMWARLSGTEKKLQAGHFYVPENLNSVQLATFLSQAKPAEINVTLIEGWDNYQITEQLANSLDLNRRIMDSLCADSGFCNSFGIDKNNLIGYLLPDTYAFHKGFTETEVLSVLVNRTLSVFAQDSVKRAVEAINYSRDQILTLASIVEGEAIFDDERATIAAVYLNRLKKGMRLQADPTIQYIIDGPPRRLLYKDLEIDSPYNTYKYYGLPPGPINNPGLKSILATIFAEKVKYLYFVARGDGRHTFSNTLKEHNRAKLAFDKIRRDVRRQR
ncbi:MAG: endolytic transglycosylase MltG [Calditrichaceae bacterium]|nr:endolytic transglycosylase MltG [Calditrichaceae bacterium]